MLSFSVVKSAGSAGNYYTDKDNYYVLGSMGERWAGQGAEQLGLQGSVDKDVFTRLLEGRLPDGADLSRMQDGSNKHRPGYDLTFSAPKSVSMMAMLGGDKRLIDAHNQAVDFAVRQVEALASTRVMTDGQSETVLTGNRRRVIGDHRIKRWVHRAHFFLMMYRNVAPRESAGDKELCRRNGALQTVGIGIYRVRRRAFA